MKNVEDEWMQWQI